MVTSVDAPTLKGWLHDGAEIALLDVREHGQYGEAHLFYGVPLPYSRLEADIERLAPRRSVRVVLYDDGESGVAQRAARRAEALGYTNVHVLQDGVAGWLRGGYRLFAGVNVPSKTFGELVEHEYDTPRIGAAELKAMMDRGEDLVVVDGRPFSEYHKMNIPGSISCPNGELALRIGVIAPDPRTKVIVNCAGRTRSIIGAQTLATFGIANPVYALENGTQGWFLAGLELERGSERRHPDAPPAAQVGELARRAAELAERYGVPEVDARTLRTWRDDASRTTYLLDVRTREEFIASHLPGSVHAPGGQLVQATDQWVGVRNARLVVVDAEGVRARLTAIWLRQLGHDVHVLRDGIVAALGAHVREHRSDAVLPQLEEIDAARLHELVSRGECVAVDLRAGMSYRRAHVPGSRWSIRPRIAAAVGDWKGPVVLIADEPLIARATAVDLAEAGIVETSMLRGSFEAWRAAGLPSETTPDRPADAECIDYLFFVHDRHDGNAEAARRYLAWELDLVKQLDAQELGAYRIVNAS